MNNAEPPKNDIETKLNEKLRWPGHLAFVGGVIGLGLTVAAATGANYLVSFITLFIALFAFAPDLVRADEWMKNRSWGKIARILAILAMPIALVIVFLLIIYFIGKKTGWWLF